MAKLEQTGHFDDSATQNTCNSSNSNSNSEEKEEEPQAKLWLLYLLAELEDFEHHTEAALSYIEKALEHTPTCYDLYILKGKVLKHAGALKEAAEAIGFASSLDRGDRFMNSKHVKYLLRAGNIEEADRLAGYWTKRNIMPRVDLREMQACWFEIECGLSHERAGDVVHANKMYHNVVSHFDTFVLDQFDFHPYVLFPLPSLRRLHLRSSLLPHRGRRLSSLRHPTRETVRLFSPLHSRPINKQAYLKQFPSVVVPQKGKAEANAKDTDVDGFEVREAFSLHV